jgi:hypothetical protein
MTEAILLAMALKFGILKDGSGMLYEEDCNHIRTLMNDLLVLLNVIGIVSNGRSMPCGAKQERDVCGSFSPVTCLFGISPLQRRALDERFE